MGQGETSGEVITISSFDLLLSQVSYLTLAAVQVGLLSLVIFALRPKMTSVSQAASATFTNTNWYNLSNLIAGYGLLGLFGLAFVTQVLSIFGIASFVNVLVWLVGVGLLGGTVVLTALVFNFLAYNEIYDRVLDGNDTDAT